MRVFWIVLDSAGVGNAPDAAAFGDEGSNTWKRCYDSGNLKIPHMEHLGIYQIQGMEYGRTDTEVVGCYGRMREQSQGKDTTIGHWEMAGLISSQPFPTYPQGFPQEIIEEFSGRTGRGVLCNRPYSGTEVIRDYGRQHMESGDLIVYTSADSVFQIAAHEDVVPVEELYRCCKIAREILTGPNGVGRVIARPFTGTYPDFTRTERRHDFSLVPPRDTILDQLQAAGREVIGVGKIYDIFAGKGIDRTTPNHGNHANMERVFEIMKEEFDGLCYVNLVDTDMIYGHRRDIPGYAGALSEFDVQLGRMLPGMKEDDILIITADHGCDPGYRGTDHTREMVPLLVYGKSLPQNVDLGTRSTFADIAATIGAWFGLDYHGDGSPIRELLER